MASSGVLVVIPARGGSKGIPRKNLRSLAGRPLIAYSIETALKSRYSPDVVVTSDDEEILNLAGKLGAQQHRRRAELATDEATLDEVIADVHRAMRQRGAIYGCIVTLQPTSPLLTSDSLDLAIGDFLADPALDTLISAVEDRHLRWTERDGRFEPAYEARLNRQYLPPTFRETGGFVICRPAVLETGTRFGTRVSLHPLSGGEAIDIDTREDWGLCEWYLSHKDVLFVVAGYSEIGLGHVHNALTIANELVRHRVRFLVTRGSELAYQVIAGHHYETHRQQTDDLVADIAALGPNVVINDRLDTDADEIRRLKQAGMTVVNFEDLGPGAREADLVINAIYPERERLPNHYFGPAYFCLRQEFAMTQPRPTADEVRSVLVTFGGIDPNNLTRRVVEAVHDECARRGIELSVVAGRGYQAYESLAGFTQLRIDRAVVNMADRIRQADLAFTSAGRTVFEIASLGTPAIVLAQNERELTHFFASAEHGFVNLGLGCDVPLEVIRDTFLELVEDADARRRNQQLMLSNDLRAGTARVVRLIEGVLNGSAVAA